MPPISTNQLVFKTTSFSGIFQCWCNWYILYNVGISIIQHSLFYGTIANGQDKCSRWWLSAYLAMFLSFYRWSCNFDLCLYKWKGGLMVWLFISPPDQSIMLSELRFSQPLWMVFRHFLCKKTNKNKALHVIYCWKDLPAGSKIWSSIQWICPWKYEDIGKVFVSPQSAETISVFLKIKMDVYETVLCDHTHM